MTRLVTPVDLVDEVVYLNVLGRLGKVPSVGYW